jgi:endonuclease YncB( thermonuclease family)
MQKWILRALGPGLAVGLAAVAVLSLQRSEPASPEPAASPGASAATEPAEEPVPLPPPPVPPEASTALPELPQQEVKAQVVHTVPDYEPSAVPHVTLQDAQGRTLTRPQASSSSRAKSASPPQQAALPPAPASLAGPARATGTVSLAVNGQTVRLFGVLPPASTDRCALGSSDPLPCAEVTEAMLAARLARSASITCQLPPGVGAADPARICLDAEGADIAGYLVGEGLAVADRHAGASYAGAESAARASGKGLWHYR